MSLRTEASIPAVGIVGIAQSPHRTGIQTASSGRTDKDMG